MRIFRRRRHRRDHVVWQETMRQWGIHRIDVDRLAQYNSEKARGILHTAEYAARMAEWQKRYNIAQEDWADRVGMTVLPIGESVDTTQDHR